MWDTLPVAGDVRLDRVDVGGFRDLDCAAQHPAFRALAQDKDDAVRRGRV
jgi:phosphatidylserine/phosphatidylglycerophosphate/cardiolipin synthase-like enzyme